MYRNACSKRHTSLLTGPRCFGLGIVSRPALAADGQLQARRSADKRALPLERGSGEQKIHHPSQVIGE